MNVMRAARFLLALGWRLDRARLARAVAVMFAGYLAAPFTALSLAHFADEAATRHGAAATGLVILTAVLLVAELMLSHFAHLDYFELAELQEAELRAELIDAVNRPSRISHLDDPGFADAVTVVREELFGNTRALEAVLQLAGMVLQTAVTAAILITIDPWLAVLPLLALPPVLISRWAESVLDRAKLRAAEQVRLYRHLIELATSAESVKELRLVGGGPELVRRQQLAWGQATRLITRARASSAALRSAGQLVFAAGYGGAIVFVVSRAAAGHATIGDMVLVITLAVQVSVQVTGVLQMLTLLQSSGRTVRRIESLRSAAAPGAAGAPPPGPGPLTAGITLDNVSFCYPGAARPALSGVSMTIPAGSTLALVGENGSGKSTLVKLLTGMYAPTGGKICADGVDLAEIDAAQWRAGIAALFQDFLRLDFTLREDIGVGELAELRADAAVAAAIERARAQQVVAGVPGGLDGYVGRRYSDGAELSGGQWQTVALARCLMRGRPRLLILDEPAASLDAAAEHALFQRYAVSARAGRELGHITVLISHRFSTVRMADNIAVLRDGQLAELGSHSQLMAGDGLYASLYRMQARAYR